MTELEEMWPRRWSPPSIMRRSASMKTVSGGEWPGRCRTVSVRSRSRSSSPAASGIVTSAAPPQPFARRAIARTARRTSSETPCSAMTASVHCCWASIDTSYSASHGASRSRAAMSAPDRRPTSPTSPMWSRRWWVDEHEPEIRNAVAERGQLVLERRVGGRRVRSRPSPPAASESLGTAPATRRAGFAAMRSASTARRSTELRRSRARQTATGPAPAASRLLLPPRDGLRGVARSWSWPSVGAM